MGGIVLHTENNQDIALIIQLAERLGIPYGYTPKAKAITTLPSEKEIPTVVLALVKPLQKTLDVDKLKKERKYKGVDRKRFDKLVKDMNIPQSAEELIAQL